MIVGNEIIVDPWEVISFYFFFKWGQGCWKPGRDKGDHEVYLLLGQA